MALIPLLAVSVFARYVLAVPLSTYEVLSRSNTTPNKEFAWVDGPHGRGTYDLVLSCLTTLSLCAWTAVHLNVPRTKSGCGTTFKRLQWMLIAIIFPESVLAVAFEQRTAAADLMQKINELGSEAVNGYRGRTPIVDGDECWRHGKLDVPRWRNQALAQAPYQANFERPDNTMDFPMRKPPKFAPWTLKQAFFAVLGGLSVDSTSFHTTTRFTFTPVGILQLARAGLLPDITEDEVEDRSKADAVAKILVCFQAGWFFVQSSMRLIAGLPLTLLELHTLAHICFAFAMYVVWWDKPYNVGSPIVCKEQRVIDMAALFCLRDHDGVYQPKRCCALENVIDIQSIRTVNHSSSASPKVGEHLRRANQAVEHYKRRAYHFSWCVDPQGYVFLDDAYVAQTQSNRSVKGPLYSLVSKKGRTTSDRQHDIWLLLSIVYGGIHLAAWNFSFPTAAEKWIWRSAAIALVVGPVVYSLDGLLAKVERYKGCGCLHAIRSPLFLLNIIPIMTYATARLYVLVESFISLRSPPAGTYQTVEWTKYIPHAS